MGHSSVIRAGEFQHMYAGTGVTHSETNDSSRQAVHFFQIWNVPERTGGAPTYFQTEVDLDAGKNAFLPVAGPEEQEGRATLRSAVSL